MRFRSVPDPPFAAAVPAVVRLIPSREEPGPSATDARAVSREVVRVLTGEPAQSPVNAAQLAASGR